MPLSEILSLQGAEHFHRLESVLCKGERMLIATGGSIVAPPATFERLRARPDEHLKLVANQGDRRPMQGRPRALQELVELLARREPL